jgi:hypothetical protein
MVYLLLEITHLLFNLVQNFHHYLTSHGLKNATKSVPQISGVLIRMEVSLLDGSKFGLWQLLTLWRQLRNSNHSFTSLLYGYPWSHIKL